MRVAIIASNGYLDKRIERLLGSNNIKGDIMNKFTRNQIYAYDCVIFTHKNDIPNLPVLIERLVLEKQVLVIYVNNTSSLGKMYNVLDDIFFAYVNEQTMDIELPVILNSSVKYLKKITYLQKNHDDMKDQLETIKLTNKAKRLLMNKGLTEEESHQFIQKKAMDLRTSKKNLVNLIIENKIDI